MLGRSVKVLTIHICCAFQTIPFMTGITHRRQLLIPADCQRSDPDISEHCFVACTLMPGPPSLSLHWWDRRRGTSSSTIYWIQNSPLDLEHKCWDWGGHGEVTCSQHSLWALPQPSSTASLSYLLPISGREWGLPQPREAEGNWDLPWQLI